MATSTWVKLSAVIEVATGAALIAVPGFVAQVLLGAGLSDSGIAVARLTGIALLCLGLASWPVAEGVTRAAIRALFTYNLLCSFLSRLSQSWRRLRQPPSMACVRPACVAGASAGASGL